MVFWAKRSKTFYTYVCTYMYQYISLYTHICIHTHKGDTKCSRTHKIFEREQEGR